MKAEIIAIGTELLIGDVVNTNATWISKQLADLGVDVYYHLTVGDNPNRIRLVVEQALLRSDILIFTGGLGPTDDDLTIATLANCFNAALISDPESEAAIQARFAARNMPMSPSNLKQALRPEEATVIQNPVGTAPGIAWQVKADNPAGKALLLTFPGVPRELYAMWPQGAAHIQQFQAQCKESAQVLVTRYLHFFGIGESKLGEMLCDLMEQANPTVAPYVGRASVKIRVAAKAASRAQANMLIDECASEIITRCGQYAIGTDEATLESLVAQKLLEEQVTLGVAESCTGGLLSSRLTDIPGSSVYTRLNVVTYSNEQKTALLGVKVETLQNHGAVSPEVATEMVLGMLHRAETDWAASITGIAGPGGGSAEKPVGLAYIGIAQKTPQGPQSWVKRVQLNANYERSELKFWFSQYALYYLLKALNGQLETEIH